MSPTAQTGRAQKNLWLTLTATKLLDKLSTMKGISASAIIETLIREEAARLKLS